MITLSPRTSRIPLGSAILSAGGSLPPSCILLSTSWTICAISAGVTPAWLWAGLADSRGCACGALASGVTAGAATACSSAKIIRIPHSRAASLAAGVIIVFGATVSVLSGRSHNFLISAAVMRVFTYVCHLLTEYIVSVGNGAKESLPSPQAFPCLMQGRHRPQPKRLLMTHRL